MVDSSSFPLLLDLFPVIQRVLFLVQQRSVHSDDSSKMGLWDQPLLLQSDESVRSVQLFLFPPDHIQFVHNAPGLGTHQLVGGPISVFSVFQPLQNLISVFPADADLQCSIDAVIVQNAVQSRTLCLCLGVQSVNGLWFHHRIDIVGGDDLGGFMESIGMGRSEGRNRARSGKLASSRDRGEIKGFMAYSRIIEELV